jgi:polyisoprenoid-binding protein YceI
MPAWAAGLESSDLAEHYPSYRPSLLTVLRVGPLGAFSHLEQECRGNVVRNSSAKGGLMKRLLIVASFLILSVAQSSRAQAPVITFTKDASSVGFSVKASVAIDGKFDNWEATMTFPSTDVTTGVLDIKIHADSINTGSGMKDGKLKGKDFFNVKEDPFITFHADKVVQTGPNTFDIPGMFTIRGVSKPQTLTFTVTGIGTGSGEVKGTMAFDRKDYGMTSGIPFVKIADRVEVSVDLVGKRTGPPLVFKQ